MTTQPARNIAITNEFPDAIFMRATCECTSPKHDHNIMVELEEYNLTVTIYSELEWAQYSKHDETMLQHYWRRLKNAVTYLFTGRVAVSSEFMMSEKTARDYASAIQLAADQLRKNLDGRFP